MYQRTAIAVIILVGLSLVVGNLAMAGQIHDAAKNGEFEKVRTLIENDGKQLNARDDEGKTALLHAISAGHIDIAAYLIEQGADINLVDKDNESPLHCAAALGDTGLTRMVLERGATSINVGGFRNMTPLHWACENGHADVARILLASGADTEARDVQGMTALMTAAGSRNMELIQTLVEGGADLNVDVKHGGRVYNMLIVAVMYGFKDLANFLIAQNVPVPQSMLNYACAMAVRNNMPRLFSYVQEQGLDIAALSETDPDLIFSAVSGGARGMVDLLLQEGFDLKRVDKDGWTAMHYAAVSHDTAMVGYLIGKGLDIEARNARGETAYHLARFVNDSIAVGYLIKAGADTADPQFPRLSGPYMGQTPPGDTPEMFLPGIVSAHYRAHSSIAFSPDGKTAYWTEMSPGEGGVTGMEMIGSSWTSPKPYVMERDPSFSPDGNRLYFIKVRPFRPGEKPAGERDGWECYWYMEKTAIGWSEPISVGDAVNSVGVHWPCSVDKDYNLYFSQFADSMYCSFYHDGVYQKPVPLTTLFKNTTLIGRSPFVAPNRDYLLFSTEGGVHITFRKNDGTWTDRISLGPEINASGENGSARVTPDGKYIVFVSSGENRPWGIYWVSADIIDRLKKEHLGDN